MASAPDFLYGLSIWSVTGWVKSNLDPHSCPWHGSAEQFLSDSRLDQATAPPPSGASR